MTAGSPELSQVTINGIDCNSYVIRWGKGTTRGKGTIRGINIVLSKSVEAILDITDSLNGKAVTVQRGVSLSTEKYVFRGEVTKVNKSPSIVSIECSDKLFESKKKTVTKSFDKNIDTEAGIFSEIFKSLINDYTSLTADATSVQDSGTVFVIGKFICRAATVYDRLTALAEAINWQFYYNQITDKVVFEPVGYVNQASLLSTGNNIRRVPVWRSDANKLFNIIEVRGSRQEVERTDAGQIGVTTGFTTVSITLQKKPISVKVLSDALSTPITVLIGGKEGSTPIADYDYSVDAENKKIIWNTATYTPGASDYVWVQYSYFLETPVIVQDDISISTYGQLDDNGDPIPKKMVIKKPDIVNVTDAEVYADSSLSDRKDPILKTTLHVTNVDDLDVGQSVEVSDDENSIYGFFIIESIRKKYPYRYDEVDVVSNIIDEGSYRPIMEARINRLEEQNMADDEILLHPINVSTNTVYESWYAEKRSVSVINTFVLDNPDYNVLDTDSLESSSPAEVTVQLVQGGRIYREFFYDTTFKEASGFTADWDVVNKWIDFTTGEVAISSLIHDSGKSIKNAKITIAGTTTSNLGLEMQVDGSNWESVSSGSDYYFINVGTSLKWKMTATGNAVVTYIIIRITEED